MGYRTECIEYSKVPGMISRFPFALVYKISDVIVGRNDSDADDTLKECTEARFFGKTEELHVLAEERRAVLITDTGSDGDSIEKEIRLKERFCTAGGSLIIKQYLGDDSDGQCHVELTRLKEIV